jgi:hypothetical protein
MRWAARADAEILSRNDVVCNCFALAGFQVRGGKTMATKKAAKKSAKKSATRKYSPAASKSVEREMKAMKQGTLKSGGSGKKVTNPKQAIAIGLSEARREGKKVPKKKS